MCGSRFYNLSLTYPDNKNNCNIYKNKDKNSKNKKQKNITTISKTIKITTSI